MTATTSTPPTPPANWSNLPFDDAGELVRAATQRLTLARIVSIVLAATVLGSLLLAPMLRFGGYGDVLGFTGLAAAGVWLFLGVSAAKHGRRVREAAALASVGRPDLAEGRARETLEAFSLLRPVTVGAAAVLARIRHSQGRFAEAARLAAFVISRPEKVMGSDKRAIRLLLAESLLAAGDVAGAQAAALPLYAPPSPREGSLSLSDAMRLLAIQLTADARQGRWMALREGLGQKLDMVELMAPPESARMTALLCRAACEGGEAFADWCRFLARRVRLLANTESLTAEPALAGWALPNPEAS